MAALSEILDLDRIEAVLQEGEETHPGRSLSDGILRDDHIAHAVAHLQRHVAGETDEDHLGHAAVRLLMEITRLAWTGEDGALGPWGRGAR
jgi:hypothetical protein